ncbi:hypothetical protein I3F60_11220 [Streptomyces sp. MUM 136J]|nr:hypothetical protein [Streptomyces sp. MUM 136J]MCH0569817.1 hypothetical protein [Streptomyces sp. MUM 136J]
MGVAGHRDQQWKIGECLEGSGGGVSVVGEEELDLSGEISVPVVVLDLAHHRHEGRPVGRVVVDFDGQEELTSGAGDLDVVSLEVAAVFAVDQSGIGVAQAGS